MDSGILPFFRRGRGLVLLDAPDREAGPDTYGWPCSARWKVSGVWGRKQGIGHYANVAAEGAHSNVLKDTHARQLRNATNALSLPAQTSAPVPGLGASTSSSNHAGSFFRNRRRW